EIMCHPAYIDKFLRDHSSFVMPRIEELDLLTSEHAKSTFNKANGITLINYSQLYCQRGTFVMMRFLQKLGKSMLIPIVALPAAGILFRISSEDLLDWKLFQASGAIFNNID